MSQLNSPEMAPVRFEELAVYQHKGVWQTNSWCEMGVWFEGVTLQIGIKPKCFHLKRT